MDTNMQGGTEWSSGRVDGVETSVSVLSSVDSLRASSSCSVSPRGLLKSPICRRPMERSEGGAQPTCRQTAPEVLRCLAVQD